MRGLDAVGTFGAAAYSIHGNADWGELLANPEVRPQLFRPAYLPADVEAVLGESRYKITYLRFDSSTAWGYWATMPHALQTHVGRLRKLGALMVSEF